jgi:hypothetical protein
MTRWTLGLTDSIERSVLVLWLGAALFFALGVAPAAFAVLPDPGLAGALIGRLLPPLFVTGAVFGLLIVAMELWRHGPRRRWRASAASVMLATCALDSSSLAPESVACEARWLGLLRRSSATIRDALRSVACTRSAWRPWAWL